EDKETWRRQRGPCRVAALPVSPTPGLLVFPQRSQRRPHFLHRAAMIRRELFVVVCAGTMGAAGLFSLSAPAIGHAAFNHALKQQVVEEEEEVVVDDDDERPPVVAQAAAAGEGGAAAATAAQPDSPRMTRLKQLVYDRRPSAMLRAWAKPAGKELD